MKAALAHIFAGVEAHAPVHGDPVALIDVRDAADDLRDRHPPGAILIGLDRQARTPDVPADAFDVLLTSAPRPPAPWVGSESIEDEAKRLQLIGAAHPFAASIFAQTLRIGESLSFADALILESLAYSTLLGGADFRAWLEGRGAAAAPSDDSARVRMTRDGVRLKITLSRAQSRNAIDARMRDELTEALSAALDDPTARVVELRSAGKAFSVGGDLAEFGLSDDAARGHAIRTLRAPALLLRRLGSRATAFVQGACIGAGLEIAAAAARVVAEETSWFQLPEIGMGLMTGAGGSAAVPRRIGRHRTLHWALTGKRMHARAALACGLVDEIAERLA